MNRIFHLGRAYILRMYLALKQSEDRYLGQTLTEGHEAVLAV